MIRKLAILTAALYFVTVGSALAQEKKSNYNNAKEIIYMIFPAQTRGIMLKIAGCETGGTYSPHAYNSSGASGIFQILSGHDGTVYTYNGISIRVSKYKLFDAHYNALVAYLMSSGGTNLDPWYPSRSCWD